MGDCWDLVCLALGFFFLMLFCLVCLGVFFCFLLCFGLVWFGFGFGFVFSVASQKKANEIW